MRWFYSFASVVLLALVLIGFQQFYLHGRAQGGRPLTPPIRMLVIIHGVTMSAWILLAVVQPLLVAVGNRRAHMLLGKVAAVLALVIVFAGVRVAFASASVTPPQVRLFGLNPTQFLAVPLMGVMVFAGYVVIGIWQRKRPQVHRPMMFLATLCVVSAAVGRIDQFNNFFAGTIWERQLSAFPALLVIGAILIAIKCAVGRSVDRPLLAGFAGLVVFSWLTTQIALTDTWHQFAMWATR